MTAKKKHARSKPAPTRQQKTPAQRPAASTAASKSPPAAAAAAAAVPPNYSALHAAAEVLRASGQPMSCPELIAQMAAKGYWTSPKGKTPSATLYAALAREVKRKGPASRFIKSGPGRFAARDGTDS